MPRLVSPTGITVSVSDEKAERLLATGYKAADKATPKAGAEGTKAPAKKAAAPKKAAESAGSN